MALILAIDTSCDETSAAVVDGRRVLSNVISSQIAIHKKYGGVYPALAKRAHEERIDFVIKEALRRAGLCHLERNAVQSRDPFPPQEKTTKERDSSTPSSVGMTINKIDAIAVTYGPGLAIALEVGIRKAKELVNSKSLNPYPLTPKLIAVNHLEGHILSTVAQNSKGIPNRDLAFPSLCLIVSGGHTELVLMEDFGKYKVLGATLDDACGEALDKAAKILKLGYPGGPIIERLALSLREAEGDEAIPSGNYSMGLPRGKAPRNDTIFKFTQPMKDKSNLNFSYSGLKTQLLYLVQKMSEEEFNSSLHELAYGFQEACFEQIIRKAKAAIEIYRPKSIAAGGGVIANSYLRKLIRYLAKKNNIPAFFPTSKRLITDNAAMIGVAASFKFARKEFIEDLDSLDRQPRLSLSSK